MQIFVKYEKRKKKYGGFQGPFSVSGKNLRFHFYCVLILPTELTGFQIVRLFQLFALAFNQNKTVHTMVLRVNIRLPWEVLGHINNLKKMIT
jgi:hypothetical protein